MVSALIGRVTGQGLAQNMGEVLPRWLVTVLVALLFIANTINVGADLAAMGEAAKLVAGFGEHAFTIFFALLSLVLQLFIPYRRYARFLTVLTFSLFAYVALLFMLKLDWARHRRRPDRPASRSHRRAPPPPSWRSSAPPSAPICSSGRAPRKWRKWTRSRTSIPCWTRPSEAPRSDVAHPDRHHRRHAGVQSHRAGDHDLHRRDPATRPASPTSRPPPTPPRRWSPSPGASPSRCSAWASSAPACWPCRCWRARRPMPSAKRAAGRPGWTTCPGRRAAFTP